MTRYHFFEGYVSALRDVVRQTDWRGKREIEQDIVKRIGLALKQRKAAFQKIREKASRQESDCPAIASI